MNLVCTAVLESSCFLQSDKNERNTASHEKWSDDQNGLGCCKALKWSNTMTSTDTEI